MQQQINDVEDNFNTMADRIEMEVFRRSTPKE